MVTIKREVQGVLAHEECIRTGLRGVMAAFPQTRNLIEEIIKLDLNELKTKVEYIDTVCE